VAYIAGLIIVALFFFALHSFTELTKGQKIIISSVTLGIIFGAIAFNAYSSSQREKMMDVVLKFNQNKTVKCDGLDVNNSNYTLSIGTYTFIGKKNTPNYAQMISVSECK
jgi:hypothetical protein